MSQKRPQLKLIQRPREFAAINSQVRQTIIKTIRLLEPCSVREVAERLGRKAETLYYHMDILAEAGIVREKGRRPAGKRDEALYEITCDRMQFHPTKRSPVFIKGLRRTYSAMIRETERQLLDAVGRDNEVRQGAGKNMRFQVYAAHLTKADIDELNRRLDAVRELLLERASGEGGKPHQVLLLMSPMEGAAS